MDEEKQQFLAKKKKNALKQAKKDEKKRLKRLADATVENDGKKQKFQHTHNSVERRNDDNCSTMTLSLTHDASSSSIRRLAHPGRWNFPVDYNDHFETPMEGRFL